MLDPKFKVTIIEDSSEKGVYSYEPFNMSFGNSIGNAMRRTLLSSLPGAALSYVRFEQAPHLFTTIKGVKESVLDIVLNMKKIRFKSKGNDRVTIRLDASGAKKIYAKDLEGDIEVVNGDLYICEMTDAKSKLVIEAIVEVGYGYQGADDKAQESGYIAVDSAFSPVVKVNFTVQETRVGRKTDFEKLTLEVETDGSMSPKQAITEASAILSKHFTVFGQPEVSEDKKFDRNVEPVQEPSKPKAYETIIDELNLPSRVINALLREHIETVGDLVERGKEDLTNLKGVGKKSIDLIIDELKKMDVELS